MGEKTTYTGFGGTAREAEDMLKGILEEKFWDYVDLRKLRLRYDVDWGKKGHFYTCSTDVDETERKGKDMAETTVIVRSGWKKNVEKKECPECGCKSIHSRGCSSYKNSEWKWNDNAARFEDVVVSEKLQREYECLECGCIFMTVLTPDANDGITVTYNTDTNVTYT